VSFIPALKNSIFLKYSVRNSLRGTAMTDAPLAL
jgi:hypothetical protein